MDKARYIMIGGFLGAGKTTAVLQLARLLKQRGSRVGLITNDQSHGLVDTALLSSSGFPVEEITGGCFCCKFDSLVNASDKLSRKQRPDVFLAEPVGSCTDLKATVDYPLRRMYGDNYSIAPLSVMVDPLRALRILGLESGKSFSPKVIYVYRKQLEEADIIVINKSDLLSLKQLERLRRALQECFSPDKVLSVSARNGEGIEKWFEQIAQLRVSSNSNLEVDYDTYADGEALLGWLNCSLGIEAIVPFDGNALLGKMMAVIRSETLSRGGEIAHLKMTLIPNEHGKDIGVANLSRSDTAPEQSHVLQETLSAGELIVNLRAEANPETLRTIMQEVFENLVQDHGLAVKINHIESFRPARPNPTHRLQAWESDGRLTQPSST